MFFIEGNRMNWFNQFQTEMLALRLPLLFLVGIFIIAGFFSGRIVKKIKLPSLIGFMLMGVLLGPSLLNILSGDTQKSLQFITEICLGFVALSIGLELRYTTLKNQGIGMLLVIFMESFLAFFIVTLLVWLVTKDLALALIFGSIAPASAPAGTVAVIQEYKAKGPLTKALYTVVGFDDGLGIIIFGFAFTIAKTLILQEAGTNSGMLAVVLLKPLLEIGLTLIVGVGLAFLFKLLTFHLKSQRDIFIITFAIVTMGCGLSTLLNMSLILTNMIIGLVIVNTTPQPFITKVSNQTEEIMPLLFLLFFLLAGSNLHITALPAMGVIGLVYIIGRSCGLLGGAWLGSLLGKLPTVIRKYLGLGILSQAGVAIGLSLVVKQDFLSLFKDFSPEGATAGQLAAYEHANFIGNNVITMITATCIIFEIIGPITTKIALKKAKEINV